MPPLSWTRSGCSVARWVPSTCSQRHSLPTRCVPCTASGRDTRWVCVTIAKWLSKVWFGLVIQSRWWLCFLTVSSGYGWVYVTWKFMVTSLRSLYLIQSTAWFPAHSSCTICACVCVRLCTRERSNRNFIGAEFGSQARQTRRQYIDSTVTVHNPRVKELCMNTTKWWSYSCWSQYDENIHELTCITCHVQ